MALLQRAVDLDTDGNATVRDHLGDALYRTGDRDGAMRAWSFAESAAASWLSRSRSADPPAWLTKKYTDLQTSASMKQKALRMQNSPPIAPTWAESDSAKRARPAPTAGKTPAPAIDGEKR